MATGLLIALASFFCAISLAMAVAANRALQHHERLPGLFSLTGKAARLDPRPVALFVAPALLTLIFLLTIAIDLAFPADANGEAALVIVCTGIAMIISQIVALRLTRRWVEAQP